MTRALLTIIAAFMIMMPSHARADMVAPVDPNYACTQDSDCVVKDQHNCCGYYPACMNVNATIDIAAVEKDCKDKGIAGVCGFPVINSCSCVHGTCAAAPSSDAPQQSDIPQ